MAKDKNDKIEIPPLVEGVIRGLLPGRGEAVAVATDKEAEDAFGVALVIAFSGQAFEKKIEQDLQKKGSAAAAIKFVTEMSNVRKAFFGRKKPKPPKKGTTRKPVELPRVCDVILRAATKGFGTHGGKIPDARLALGAMVPDPSASAASAGAPGLHSGSADLAFRISGADAQITSALRFLGMPLSIAGAPTIRVGEILADRRHPLQSGIREMLGEDAWDMLDRIGDAVRRRLNDGAVPSEISAHRKQVLFPVGDGRYVSLSPLYSYGLAAELSCRLRERQSRDLGEGQQRFSTRVVHVGGTKPQNAGLLPTFLGGEMPRLLAMPWTPGVGTRDDALRRLRSGTVPLPAPAMRKSSFESLQRAMGGPPDNKQTRTKIENALRMMVDDTLWAVCLLAEMQASAEAEGGVLVDADAVPAHNILAARLAGIVRKPPVTDGEIDGVADDVARIVRGRLRGRQYTTYKGAKQTFAPGDEAHNYILNVAVQALKEFR